MHIGLMADLYRSYITPEQNNNTRYSATGCVRLHNPDAACFFYTCDLRYATLMFQPTHTYIMNKIILSLICAVAIGSVASSIYADNISDRQKERKELAKASKKQLNEKATKQARKEAKNLKKQGWTVAPGALPVEKQLDRSYLMQYEFDNDGYQTYIMAEGMSVGGSYDAAKMQALELAKQNLAGQIQTEITALVENSVSNEQLTEGEVATVTRSVLASKNMISQSLGRVIPVVELYRPTEKNNKEVLVRLAYNTENAKRAAIKAIEQDLGERADSLHVRLNKILGL